MYFLRDQLDSPRSTAEILVDLEIFAQSRDKTMMHSAFSNNPVEIIDLTEEETDHLSALPTELIHEIIGFLFAVHEPDKAGDVDNDYQTQSKRCNHPLDYLAATCKPMRATINDWCRLYLNKHRNITKYKAFKTPKLQARRNFMRGRRTGLLDWIVKHCVFCGEKTSREAIFMNGLHCCSTCDLEHWPNKISKSDARREFRLTDEHLQPQNYVSASTFRMLRKHQGGVCGLPILRYGTDRTSFLMSTLFLRKDVKRLARLVHGDSRRHVPGVMPAQS